MAVFCAYCGDDTAITRDHVWPEAFLSRLGRRCAHFSHQTSKAHGADSVVSDVCKVCNNGPLSVIDNYFCGLYDSYFSIEYGFADEVEFHYNFDLLARALLKISYNSARSAGSDWTILSTLRGYVLNGIPQPVQFAMFGELVSPALLVDATTGEPVRIVSPVGTYRSCISSVTGQIGDQVYCRLITIGSFWFHLVLPRQEMSDDQFEANAVGFAAVLGEIVRVTASNEIVTLRTSVRDGVSSIAKHVVENGEAYRKFYMRRRN